MRSGLVCLLLLGTWSFVAAEEHPNVVLIVADLILEGRAPPEARTFFWRTDYLAYKQRAVRHGRFKYLLDDTIEFLFDLETDIGERRNLAYRHPDVVKELQSALAAWEKELAR